MDNNKGADMNELAQAVDAVKALERALAEANEKARQIAVARVRDAQAALVEAKRQAESFGVKASPRAGNGAHMRRPEQRAAAAERARNAWANKTPEQRAAWSNAISKARTAHVQ